MFVGGFLLFLYFGNTNAHFTCAATLANETKTA